MHHARSLWLALLAAPSLLHGAIAQPIDPKTVATTVFAKDLQGPRGLLFLASGDLLVAEQSGGSIARVARDGQVTRIASGLLSPHDLDVDPQGNVYVAETGSDRVALVSPSGKVSAYVDGLDGPVDLAFNLAGELLVCELRSGRVLAFKSPTARRVFASGLRGPHGLAFAKSGGTFVNDWPGSKVVKVGTDGRIDILAKVEGPVGLALAPSGIFTSRSPRPGSCRGSNRTAP